MVIILLCINYQPIKTIAMTNSEFQIQNKNLTSNIIESEKLRYLQEITRTSISTNKIISFWDVLGKIALALSIVIILAYFVFIL